jgi:hypothetical protein
MSTTNTGDLPPSADPEEIPTPPLSADLTALLQSSCDHAMTVDELHGALKGRGIAMLLLLLALPFCFIPIPGLSTPFGFAIMVIGIRIAGRRTPWLPQFILRRTISAQQLQTVLTSALRLARLMEKVVRPRWHFLHHWPGSKTVIGLSIAAGGGLLLLPLPIPFSNTAPAWAIVFLTAGMMERDGFVVLLGHALTFVGWAFVIYGTLLGFEGIHRLFQ